MASARSRSFGSWYDTFTADRHVTPALKAAWPIIALFFPVIGLALYVALGLLAGFIFTYPMNWWLVKIEWKHGVT